MDAPACLDLAIAAVMTLWSVGTLLQPHQHKSIATHREVYSNRRNPSSPSLRLILLSRYTVFRIAFTMSEARRFGRVASIMVEPAPGQAKDCFNFAIDAKNTHLYGAWAASDASRQAKLKREWDEAVPFIADLTVGHVMERRDGDHAEDQFSRISMLARHQGVPSVYRPVVWCILAREWARKVDKELFVPGYYESILTFHEEQSAMAPGDGTETNIQIDKDMLRTFPGHKDFSDFEAPKVQALRRVCRAFACRNPSMGYVQSMNYIAGACLLVVKDEEATFWLLVAILECYLPAYFDRDLSGVRADCAALSSLLDVLSPELAAHLRSLDLQLSLVTTPWMMSLFVMCAQSTVWTSALDYVFVQGRQAVPRTCAALLRRCQAGVLRCQDASAAMQVLGQIVSSVFDGASVISGARDGVMLFPYEQFDEIIAREEATVKAEIDAIGWKRQVHELTRRTSFTPTDLRRLKDQFTVALKHSQRQDGLDRASFAMVIAELRSNISSAETSACDGTQGHGRDATKGSQNPLDVHSPVSSDRLFWSFDADRNGAVDFKELMIGLSVLCAGSFDDKLRAIFSCIDSDDSGFLDRSEARVMLASIFALVGGSGVEDAALNSSVDSYLTMMFDHYDVNGDGQLSEEEFRMAVLANPVLMEGFSFAADTSSLKIWTPPDRSVRFRLGARGLQRADTLGKLFKSVDVGKLMKMDPYYIIERKRKFATSKSDAMQRIAKSTVVAGSPNPEWSEVNICTNALCQQDDSLPFTIRIMDKQQIGMDVELCRLETTLGDLQETFLNSGRMPLKPHGELTVILVEVLNDDEHASGAGGHAH